MAKRKSKKAAAKSDGPPRKKAKRPAKKRPAADEEMPRIGWKETIDLPEWHLEGVLSKSDTGAQTSAIDAEEVIQPKKGRVRFTVVGRRKGTSRRKMIEADVVREVSVRSSNGKMETRYVVATPVKVGGTKFMTEFTLVSRHSMRCRVLLGRAALAGRFLVDSEHTYLLSEPPAATTKKARR